VRTARTVGIGRPLRERVRHFLGIARTPDVTRALIAVRCDRGAEIARSIGFPDLTADAIGALDEHWDGGGYPDGLRGDAIPRLAQIALLAQTVEAFHAAGGVRGALRAVRARRGSWFDPRLADRVLGWKRDRAWWAALGGRDAAQGVAALEPADRVRHVDDAGLDLVARAFADIIDAKSPYTFRHSTNVAGYAAGIAATVGLSGDERRRLHRAGLLHDVGKLGVSNRILDSPARLGPDERAQVERHPAYTWEILRGVRAFAGFAWTAATHHEKLDGSGYPWRLDAGQLDLPARILTVADIYEALTADRPYRAGMSHGDAMAIIARDRGRALDATVVDALDTWAAGHGIGTAPARPSVAIAA
jgi:HD-GYP domain-containing protein (c-di-GMP phosphodiesterase class II)